MRIVIRTPHARRARALQDGLAAAGLDAAALAGPAAYRPAPDGEDIALLDGADADAPELARALRRDVGAALAYVGAVSAREVPGAGLDGWVALDGVASGLKRKLEDMHRDGVVAEEVRARRRTAAQLGLPAAPEPAPPRQFSILYVGAPAPAYLDLERAWGAVGGRCAGTFTSFSAFDHLQDDRFDAVVLNAAQDPAAALSLGAAMRRNTSLNQTPALVVTRNGDIETATAAAARGASIADDSTDLNVAMAWLAEDVRRARLRRAVRQAATALPEPTSPWSSAVFAAHLDTQALAHHNRGRTLTLAALRVLGVSRDVAGKRGIEELSGLSARLVRAADSMSLYSDGIWLFAFPSTSEQGARAALHRIVAVCECTSFAAGDESHAPLSFRIHALELAPGESGAGLLARLLDSVENRVRRA